MINSFNRENILSSLASLNLGINDNLFIHSSLRALGTFDKGNLKDDNVISALFDCFSQTIGDNGTIAVPTFNFDFFNGNDFDVDNTPSKNMGAFSEYIRCLPNSFRTTHPFHSISAIGPLAKYISNIEGYSEFSEDGFFEALIDKNFKIIFLGIEFVETFFHLAEERARVPYRFWKKIYGNRIQNGNKQEISVNYYARKINKIPEPIIDVSKIHQLLIKNNLIKYCPLGSGKIGVGTSNKIVDSLTKVLIQYPDFALKVN